MSAPRISPAARTPGGQKTVTLPRPRHFTETPPPRLPAGQPLAVAPPGVPEDVRGSAMKRNR